MNWRVRRIIKCELLICVVFLLILFIVYSLLKKNEEFSFSSFNNITGSPFKIIPNTVHYVIFSTSSLNFISFLSLVSVIKIQESNIWIHCDSNEISGYYWSLVESLSKLTRVPVKVSFMRRPTHVYGQLLSSVYHASDIARIQVLMESGGIYLDTDMVLLKPLDQFLHYEMVVGWPHNEYFGNQIMIGHPKARFLQKYLESYRRYLPREWYYNGGQVPTEQVLMRQPHLVHRVPLLFGVHNLVDRLYGPNPWTDWRQYYAIHLLSRHHSDPEHLNETTIVHYNKPFGEIARNNDGFHSLKQQFLNDYKRRKRQDEEFVRRSLGALNLNENEASNAIANIGSLVDSVGFDNDERGAHHTDKYELMDGNSPTPIFRRGQPFSMFLQFNQVITLQEAAFQLIVCYGPNPSYNDGTKFVIALSEGEQQSPLQWTMWIAEQSQSLIRLMISSPSKCQVGLWKFKFVSGADDGYPCPAENVFYMLFNPWCAEDEVFLDDESSRQQYVLCDDGVLFSGTDKAPSSRQWVYGQFDYAVLPTTILLLEKSQTSCSERGSGVVIARAIAAVVNSNDEQGLVLGSWDNNYTNGTPPEAWTGSTAIFEQYLASGGAPVCYGQCWVYAGCVTTACRALGIPCRTITCFNSAHDSNNTLTVDTYFDQNGHVMGNMSYDMVWNYHCWNEVWISRPDLPQGFSGWNVIDSTPQKQSGGLFRVGPAAVKAICDGDVGLQFDVDFVFSEVNSDICYFYSDPQSPWGFTLSHLDTKTVGDLIVTQECTHGYAHEISMKNITNTYKAPEGSNQERKVFYKALMQLPKAQKFYEHVHPDISTSDVVFNFQRITSLEYGEPFDVSLSIENKSNEVRDVSVTLDVSSALYTGRSLSKVKQGDVYVSLQPKETKAVKMTVTDDEYRSKLRNTPNIKMLSVCHVKQTKHTHAAQDVFEVIKSKLIVEVPPTVKMGDVFEAKLTFQNPTNQELSSCTLVIEGPGLQRPKILALGNLAAGKQMVKTVHLTPKREGPLTLLGIFSSNQLTDIRGNASLTVLQA